MIMTRVQPSVRRTSMTATPLGGWGVLPPMALTVLWGGQLPASTALLGLTSLPAQVMDQDMDFMLILIWPSSRAYIQNVNAYLIGLNHHFLIWTCIFKIEVHIITLTNLILILIFIILTFLHQARKQRSPSVTYPSPLSSLSLSSSSHTLVWVPLLPSLNLTVSWWVDVRLYDYLLPLYLLPLEYSAFLMIS